MHGIHMHFCICAIIDDQGAVCPVGMVLNPCGSLCQRTCELYLTNTRLDCPDMCALPDCACVSSWNGAVQRSMYRPTGVLQSDKPYVMSLL